MSCVLLLPAGRSELPDNLKAMLRPVSMMVPDFTLIAEIVMFSEGFSSAKVLAKKMIAIMELSQQQLSKQDHYDATLRCALCAGQHNFAAVFRCTSALPHLVGGSLKF
jgi:methionine-rich copper-binding protein CopC